MRQIRRSADRGHADHGWLDTRHTFSFAGYRDPNHMGFRRLRVMNEDRVSPGRGFGEHAHDNMEIVSYVLSGALEHRDSMGNGEVLTPGEFQRMSAGTGIRHSEFNPSAAEPAHFYQIWLFPEREGIEPSYEQRRFDDAELNNRLRPVATPEGTEGSLTIHTPAQIFLGRLDSDATVTHAITDGRHAWLQILRGSVAVGTDELHAGDGLAVSDEPELGLRAIEPAEVLVFDLD